MSVEAPALFTIRKNRAEHPARLRLAKEVVLIWSLVVGIPRRDHHALNASLHQLIEVCTHRVRIGAIEQRRIRRHTEALLHRLVDTFHRHIVSTLTADTEVMVLTLSIHVD